MDYPVVDAISFDYRTFLGIVAQAYSKYFAWFSGRLIYPVATPQ
jgi:hypothetical protein